MLQNALMAVNKHTTYFHGSTMSAKNDKMFVEKMTPT